MKFEIIYFNEIVTYFYKTALFEAVMRNNIEIIKLLLSYDKIDVNILNIILFFFNEIIYIYISIAFKSTYLNEIGNQIFQFH